MKINVFVPESPGPLVSDVVGATTVGQALEQLQDPNLRVRLVDESGIKRYVSAYLGVPGMGVRNVKLEQGMETAIKEGEELTLLIADPHISFSE